MTKWRAFHNWLFAPAHLSWRGKLFLLIAASVIMGWWFINVPWYVDYSGTRHGPMMRRIWEPSPMNDPATPGVLDRVILPVGAVLIPAPPPPTFARIAWETWLPSAALHGLIVVGLWAIIRREARFIRYNLGVCWNCGFDRKHLPRDQACPSCASPFLPKSLRPKPPMCLNCAYPIGTSDVCTECGAAVTPPRKPMEVKP